MKDLEPYYHLRGESLFIDDIPEPKECLHIAVFSSPIAAGKIVSLDYSDVLKQKDVFGVYTYKDIPGQNQIGGIIQDEPLLAEKEVDFIGQPIALVAAKDKISARKALKYFKVKFQEHEPVIDPRIAASKGMFLAPSRIFSIGNTENSWNECEYIVEGRVDSGAQEHLYLETQGAMAIPEDKGHLKVYSATQGPTSVQKIISVVLDIPMRMIEVEVKRLGGGFGGKEDQATPWGVMASLVAMITGKPAKLVLKRKEDMRFTGKRHPYSSDFKIGVDKNLKIKAYEVTLFQNGGAAADLSTAILERSLFHASNSYYLPNARITAHTCKTNLAPNTAFRGFGGPQSMFVIESAISKIASFIGVDALEIQKKNLLKDGDELPYGMKVEYCNAGKCYEEAVREFNLKKIKADINKFNKTSKLTKKGIALMPVCFGISFTNTSMNQASSLVHIYTDGSVSVSTGAIEMGQGVNHKCALVAAETLGISREYIRVESTNTKRNANTSPTAASSGCDLNGKATENACLEILGRLKRTASEMLNSDIENIQIKNSLVYNKNKKSDISWKKLVINTYLKRLDLSAHGFYSTPRIFFDRTKEKGHPFAYHVYGTAICEVTVDILRATYKVDSVKIVHDAAKSIDRNIDLGQIEGGVLQGIGWMTLEEIVHNEKGKLLSDALASYKIPDIHFAPEIQVRFLQGFENPYAVKGSKAVGEPPFMYGIGVYFALLNAVKAYNSECEVLFDAPLTPEKLLKLLSR